MAWSAFGVSPVQVPVVVFPPTEPQPWPSPNRSYPVTPVLSVEAVQDTVALVAVTLTWVTPVGALGGMTSPPPPVVPNTSNSCREYPCEASARHRWVPFIRTYRPEPERPVRSSTPPLPLVVEKMVVQVAWSVDVCSWYAVAQDLSHCSRMRCTWATEPRST